MPADLAFELSYLLSDKTGRSVEVVEWSYDPEKGMLCIRAVVDGVERSACIELKACKGLGGAKLERCISKNLVGNETLLDRLASGLAGG